MLAFSVPQFITQTSSFLLKSWFLFCPHCFYMNQLNIFMLCLNVQKINKEFLIWLSIYYAIIMYIHYVLGLLYIFWINFTISTILFSYILSIYLFNLKSIFNHFLAVKFMKITVCPIIQTMLFDSLKYLGLNYWSWD